MSVLAAAAVALSLAGCGSSSPAGTKSTTTAAAAVPAKLVDSAYVGTVKATILVDSQGYPLYVFAPDKHSKVTCTGYCASVWPPLRLPSGSTQVTGGPGVQAALIGLDGKVVTYNGWPLYGYSIDHRLGLASNEASGEGIDINGGYWYVIRTDGTPIVKQLPPAS